MSQHPSIRPFPTLGTQRLLGLLALMMTWALPAGEAAVLDQTSLAITAREVAQALDEAGDDSKRMTLGTRDALVRWQLWHARLINPAVVHRVRVEVVSMRAARGSRWDSLWYYPDMSLTARLRDKDLVTGSVEPWLDSSAPPGEPRSAYFDWAWNDPITITLTRSDYSGDSISIPIAG